VWRNNEANQFQNTGTFNHFTPTLCQRKPHVSLSSSKATHRQTYKESQMDRQHQRQSELEKVYEEATGKPAIDDFGGYTPEYVKALENKLDKMKMKLIDLNKLLENDHT
jgi:hypothetical protein